MFTPFFVWFPFMPTPSTLYWFYYESLSASPSICMQNLLLYVRIYLFILSLNRIGGIMVSVLTSSAVDCGFEPRSGQIKDYKIGICCFFDKHAALRRKSKDWLARNQNNVSEWSDMSTRGLLFQWASTIKIQLCMLV